MNKLYFLFRKKNTNSVKLLDFILPNDLNWGPLYNDQRPTDSEYAEKDSKLNK